MPQHAEHAEAVVGRRDTGKVIQLDRHAWIFADTAVRDHATRLKMNERDQISDCCSMSLP